jgi:hypothetical protein
VAAAAAAAAASLLGSRTDRRTDRGAAAPPWDEGRTVRRSAGPRAGCGCGCGGSGGGGGVCRCCRGEAAGRGDAVAAAEPLGAAARADVGVARALHGNWAPALPAAPAHGQAPGVPAADSCSRSKSVKPIVMVIGRGAGVGAVSKRAPPPSSKVRPLGALSKGPAAGMPPSPLAPLSVLAAPSLQIRPNASAAAPLPPPLSLPSARPSAASAASAAAAAEAAAGKPLGASWGTGSALEQAEVRRASDARSSVCDVRWGA